MDTLTFGLTTAVVGMGGTIATLALVAFVLHVLTRLFPPEADSKEKP